MEGVAFRSFGAPTKLLNQTPFLSTSHFFDIVNNKRIFFPIFYLKKLGIFQLHFLVRLTVQKLNHENLKDG